MAEYHFRRALAINSVSSVLRCYLSMSLHSQNDDNKSFEALDVLIQACKVDPKNPQVCPILSIYVICQKNLLMKQFFSHVISSNKIFTQLDLILST